MKEQSPKHIMESEAYSRQKAIIFREINSLNNENKVQFSTVGIPFAPITMGDPRRVNVVDYSVFKKSLQQKAELKIIKSDHKRDLIRYYGVNHKKFLNIPSKTLEGVINL